MTALPPDPVDRAGVPEAGPPDRALPRGVVVLLAAAAAVVVAGGLKAANDIVAPVVLALVLTVAVAPVRGFALRQRWPSWAATLLVLVTAYAIVLVLALSLAVATVQLAATLPDYADNADDLVAWAEANLADLGLSRATVGDALVQLDLGKVTGLLSDVLASLLGVLSSFFFLATLLFFMTADAASVRTRTELLRRDKPGIVVALDGFVRGTQRYLLVSVLFGGIVAVLDTGALWVIGVPLPALWGLLAFVTNFIPNVGFVIGLVPPALLALLDGGWGEMLAVVVLYCVLNVVIQTFIQPRYVGDAVGLNPTVTFLSLALWTYVLGSLGALLAVPMTLLVRAVLVDPDPAARWARAFIGSVPGSEPPGPAHP